MTSVSADRLAREHVYQLAAKRNDQSEVKLISIMALSKRLRVKVISHRSPKAEGKWKLSPSKRGELDAFMLMARRSNQALANRIMKARKRNNFIILNIVSKLDRDELDFDETLMVQRERIDAEVVLKSCVKDVEKLMVSMENVRNYIILQLNEIIMTFILCS